MSQAPAQAVAARFWKTRIVLGARSADHRKQSQTQRQLQGQPGYQNDARTPGRRNGDRPLEPTEPAAAGRNQLLPAAQSRAALNSLNPFMVRF